MQKNRLLPVLGGVGVVILLTLLWSRGRIEQPEVTSLAPTAPTSSVSSSTSPAPSSFPAPSPTGSSEQASTPTPASTQGLALPITDFTVRITKKMFGTYVTPAHSPVQPERFTGYHTGVDIEYGDITADVPVFAISDCQVAGSSKNMEGYGGVLALRCTWDGAVHVVVYGHVRTAKWR